MTLSAWMEETGTTQVELSALTGIPQSLLSKYARGVKTPQIRNALAIERATKGKVPVETWDSPRQQIEPPLAPKHAKRSRAA